MDNDEIIEVLRSALTDRVQDEAPPNRVLAAAVAAGRWTRLDAQVAELVADSADDLVPTGARGEGELRQLTYAAGGLTIECELAADALRGQMVPATPGTSVELVEPDGTSQAILLRPDGSFAVRPAPEGPVGIRCRRPDHPDVLTPWLVP